MWWHAGPTDLTRAQDRISTLYIDRAAVDRDGNAVVVHRKTGDVHVPATMIAALLLGPGCTITSAAVGLLADSGTSVLWTGEEGVRMYAGGTATTRSSRLLLRQAWLVSAPRRRVGVARAMYAMRFPGEDVRGLSMQQLRGREGARVRSAYRKHSERTGVPWTGRNYRAGDAFAAGDDINRSLSAANASLYGVAHAAIAALGCSPGLGFVHTGHALAFVHDVADLYKADVTIPAAFDTVASGRTSEAAVRHAVRDRVASSKLLPRIVADVYALLEEPDQLPLPDDDLPDDFGGHRPTLWADVGAAGRPEVIEGGRAYSFDGGDL